MNRWKKQGDREYFNSGRSLRCFPCTHQKHLYPYCFSTLLHFYFHLSLLRCVQPLNTRIRSPCYNSCSHTMQIRLPGYLPFLLVFVHLIRIQCAQFRQKSLIHLLPVQHLGRLYLLFSFTLYRTIYSRHRVIRKHKIALAIL